jgi:hypothetical protein
MAMIRFSKTIETLPGLATDRRDWKNRLGPEWDAACAFLMPSGRIARELDCPNPGGEYCPRQVVHHGDGSIRAVCGDRLRLCATLTLETADIEILEIDRAKLVRALAKALKLKPAPDMATHGRILPVGHHMLQAGIGFPVLLALPDPQAPISASDIASLDQDRAPVVLLVPGMSSIGTDAHQVLNQAKCRAVQLCEVFVMERPGIFRAVMPAEALFHRERAALESVLTDPQPHRVMRLPPDARWSDLTITFISDEVIHVGFGIGPTHRFEPAQLGLTDGRTGKANRQWGFLKAFALGGGEVPVHPPRHIAGYQKQKQLLSAALQQSFGIDAEPIPTAGGYYRTAFAIRDGGLSQGRPDQRPTKIR